MYSSTAQKKDNFFLFFIVFHNNFGGDSNLNKLIIAFGFRTKQMKKHFDRGTPLCDVLNVN
jgi:hypothetical protein